MLILSGFLLLMLMAALGLLAIPCIQQRKGKTFLLITVFMFLASVFLYFLSGNKEMLRQWLSFGKQHYQLLEQFQQLGGIEGIIIQIKKRLALHPNDVQGWTILGKLYIMKKDYPAAKQAFAKARLLQQH